MKKRTSFLFFIAILALLFVITDISLWFMVSSNTTTFDDAKHQYLNNYPSSLQNAQLLTAISIILLVFSGTVFLSASKTKSLKIIATIMGIVAVLLLMWKIFSLM
ncbi:hypothetical protein [Flavobacterium cerinum]|uniref:DUF4293 family protein n=1 Tax=Flavobacterium cerinum TaxID=2502784 RepID=A0A444H9Q0_9FLAO|nr:hypothetical protein [Flavobacterium cerinum]RWW99963.1 hypothetical protein EPI11_10480 [Flavobacterium cerinum]